MSNEQQEYAYVAPANIKQAMARQIIADSLKHIKEPHCFICGDTEKLLKIKMNKEKKKICEYCHNIQMNYPW